MSDGELTASVEVKIAVLGLSKVGKSSLLARWIDDVFDGDYTPTNGSTGRVNLRKIAGRIVKVSLLDASGAPRHRSIVEPRLREHSTFLVCFAASQPESLNAARAWLDGIAEIAAENHHTALFECQMDVEGDAKLRSDAKKLAAQRRALFCRTSAKTGRNVRESFERLIETALGVEPQAASKMDAKTLGSDAAVREPSVVDEDETRVRAALASAQQAAFSPGQLVQYKSVSKGGWIDTRVLSFPKEDNTIDLEIRHSADITRIRPIDMKDRKLRDAWKRGDAVEVYLQAMQAWQPTRITGVRRDKKGDDWLETPLKPAIKRYNTKVIRPISEENKAKLEQLQHSEPAPRTGRSGAGSSAGGSTGRGHPGRSRNKTLVIKYDDHSAKPDDYKVGDEVMYHSTSAGRWIPASVIAFNGDGTVDLDIRGGADRSRIRAYRAKPKPAPVDVEKLKTLQRNLKELKRRLEQTQKIHDDLQAAARQTERSLRARIRELNEQVRMLKEERTEINAKGGFQAISQLESKLRSEEKNHEQTKLELRKAEETAQQLEEKLRKIMAAKSAKASRASGRGWCRAGWFSAAK